MQIPPTKKSAALLSYRGKANKKLQNIDFQAKSQNLMDGLWHGEKKSAILQILEKQDI